MRSIPASPPTADVRPGAKYDRDLAVEPPGHAGPSRCRPCSGISSACTAAAAAWWDGRCASPPTRARDWREAASHRVLSWRLSIAMEAAFCVATLEDTLARYGEPDIFDTDQGSQFTGRALAVGARQQRHRDQHGWQRSLARQRLRREAVPRPNHSSNGQRQPRAQSQTLLLSGYPADDRTVNYLTIP